MNVRMPERALGDLRAQITAVTTGERRFLELVAALRHRRGARRPSQHHGPSEARGAREHATIPDGVYEAESFMDDDGIEIGKRIPIRVKVTVKGEEMTIDLSEVTRQVRGFYNSGFTTGIACAQVAYKCLTTPTDYPVNDGRFRPLKVIMPTGRVISAERPSPMRVWMTYPDDRDRHDLQGAGAGHPGPHHRRPSRRPGASPTSTASIPRTAACSSVGIGPLGGGWGAKHDEDGMSATVCMNDGDTHNSPTEQLEAKYPVLVERFAASG